MVRFALIIFCNIFLCTFYIHSTSILRPVIFESARLLLDHISFLSPEIATSVGRLIHSYFMAYKCSFSIITDYDVRFIVMNGSVLYFYCNVFIF